MSSYVNVVNIVLMSVETVRICPVLLGTNASLFSLSLSLAFSPPHCPSLRFPFHLPSTPVTTPILILTLSLIFLLSTSVSRLPVEPTIK